MAYNRDVVVNIGAANTGKTLLAAFVQNVSTPDTQAVNAVQNVTTAAAAAGTFTLSYGGQTTGTLAYNASTASVQSALRGLSSINGAYVTVTGSPGDYTLTFTSNLGSQPLPQTTIDNSALTYTATTTAGVANVNEVQTIKLACPSGGTFTLTFSSQTTSTLAYNASTATVQSALQALSSINGANVNVTGTPGNYTLTFVGTLAGTNVTQATLTNTGLTYTATTTIGDGTHNAVQSLIYTATAGTYTLTFGGDTTGSLSYNASTSTVQSALQGLASIGSGNLLVTGTAGSYVLSFVGTLGDAPQALITLTGNALTAAATTTDGVTPVNAVQSVDFTATAGTFTLAFNGSTTVAIPYNATTSAVQSILSDLVSVGGSNITVSGSSGAYVLTFNGTLAGAVQPLTTLTDNLIAVGSTTTAGVTFAYGYTIDSVMRDLACREVGNGFYAIIITNVPDFSQGVAYVYETALVSANNFSGSTVWGAAPVEPFRPLLGIVNLSS